MPRFLKLIDSVVVDVKVCNEQPADAGSITWEPSIPRVGIGFELRGDHWWRDSDSVDTGHCAVKVDLEGNILQMKNDITSLDGE